MEKIPKWREIMAKYMPGDFEYSGYENGYAVITNRDVKFVPKG